ncbi:MAG: hypothetical protein AAFY76_14660, partial [Cyanobacteria bacterium J06649_11]
MARKRLSDLLKEEVKKPTGDEATIDVPASEVKDMNKQTQTASSNVSCNSLTVASKSTLEEAV